MRLRQVVLLAGDMQAASAELEAVLGIQVAHRDPAIAEFSLENAMMPVGDTFLEVVSPISDDAAAARHLQRRGGDCGYMVIVQVDDLVEARRRVDAAKIRVIRDSRYGALGSELGLLTGMHLHPSDIGGAIVALNVADPPGSWAGAGAWHEWQAHIRTDVTAQLHAVQLSSERPDELATTWSAVLGCPATRNGNHPVITLDQGTCRFVPVVGDAVGLTGIDVLAPDVGRVLDHARERGFAVQGDSFHHCGVTITVVPSHDKLDKEQSS